MIEVDNRREQQARVVDQPVNLDDESLYKLPKKNPIMLSELFDNEYESKEDRVDPEI